jgi:hypothetical protein
MSYCVFFVCLRIFSYHMSLRSEFSIVMSATILASKICWFVFTNSYLYGGSCFIYVICVCLYSGVQHILTI